MTIEETYQAVLHFWFKELAPEQWFEADERLDKEIQIRFGTLHQQATAGELWKWRKTIEGRLAEVIVLDQFSRNIYRNQPEAFASDQMALALAQEAVENGLINQLDTVQRAFLFMPFMHSESLIIHDVALMLFKEKGMDSFYKAEEAHRDILLKFGRYPTRNLALKRPSTHEEQLFLEKQEHN